MACSWHLLKDNPTTVFWQTLCGKMIMKCHNITRNIFIILVKGEINKRVTGTVGKIWQCTNKTKAWPKHYGKSVSQDRYCMYLCFSNLGIIFPLVKDSFMGSRKSFTYLQRHRKRGSKKKEVMILLTSEPHLWAQSLRKLMANLILCE